MQETARWMLSEPKCLRVDDICFHHIRREGVNLSARPSELRLKTAKATCKTLMDWAGANPDLRLELEYLAWHVAKVSILDYMDCLEETENDIEIKTLINKNRADYIEIVSRLDKGNPYIEKEKLDVSMQKAIAGQTIARLYAELERIRRSRIWRLTAPLRELHMLLPGRGSSAQ